MDHESIRALLHVVDSGSVLGAARQLGISRSSLRRRLEDLEAEIGVPLLHLDPGGARTTAAGAVVVAQGRSLLENCRKMVEDARSAAGEATGIIRVVVPVGMPLALRAQAFVATHTAAPNMRFVMREVEDPVMFLNEPCELVFHEGPPPDKATWFSRVIRRQTLRVLASPAYLDARGVPQTLEDLAHHDVLGWHRPRNPADTWPLLAGGAVSVSPWIASADFMLVRTLASQGCGLLLAPQDSAVYDQDPEPLITVLDDVVGGELLFRASSPQSCESDPRTRNFLQQVKLLLDSLPES